MTERRFAQRCGECGQKTMSLATLPYSMSATHDGISYDVHIQELSVPKCTNCGAISIDDVAGKQIDDEFRRVAALLTPEEIREGRIRVGYSDEQEFAACFGVSPSTVSRWESGSQIQQRAYDDWLRVFFKNPEARRTLAELHGLTPIDQPRAPASAFT